MTATVIIPTTGSGELYKAIDSVLSQTYMVKCYVVCDGEKYFTQTKEIVDKFKSRDLQVCYLPENVGSNGFYGHRVYAAFTHLINSEYVLYLDQDNWFEPNHVMSCVDTIRKTNSDWSYSLRKIVDKSGEFICNDYCESLGKWKCFQDYHHVDTNCYCIKTDVAIKVATMFHGGWGQDRIFFNVLSTHKPKFECTGDTTVNYRLAGNAGSVKDDFFKIGNDVMMKQYNGKLPWLK